MIEQQRYRVTVRYSSLLLFWLGNCLLALGCNGLLSCASTAESRQGKNTTTYHRFASGPTYPAGKDPCQGGQNRSFNPQQPHPRIWLTPERLRVMRQQEADNTLYWKKFMESVRREGQDIPKASSAALAYAITKKKKYAEIAKAIALASASSYSSESGDVYRGDAEHLPLVYDWIHDTLKAQEKATLVQVMTKAAEADIKSRAAQGTDSDLITGGAKTTLLIAIATAGDNPKAAMLREASLKRWYDGVKDWLGGKESIKNTYIARSAGGLWMEGPKYSPDTMRYVFQFVEAEKSATGKDLLCEIKKETGRDFAYDTIMTALHLSMPNFEDGFTWSSVEEPTWPMQYERWAALVTIAAERLPGTPAARWARQFADHAPTNVSGGSSPLANVLHAEYNFEAILFPFIRPQTEKKPLDDVPFDWIAPGPGIFLARTSNDRQATGVALQSGSILRVDHVHFDTNSFQMYRQGEWLTREVRGYGMWPSLSRAHNCILLDGVGPQEKMAYVYGEGKMDAACSCPEFAFSAGNSTKAFNIDRRLNREGSPPADTAQEVVRQFVFIRPEGWLVIFDRLEVKKDSQRKEIVFRTLSKPVREGTTITSRSLTGSNLHENGRKEGSQQLQIKTVLPASGASYTVVDEKKYYAIPRPELYVNYKPEEWEVPDKEKRWHVLVRLPGKQKREYGLHVLAGYKQASELPRLEPMEAAGKKGVRLIKGKSTIEIVFNERGPTGGSFRRLVTGSPPLAKDLVKCHAAQK